MTDLDPATDTRRQLHWLAQLGDAFGHALCAADELGSHRALRIEGDRWLTAPSDEGVRLAVYDSGYLALLRDGHQFWTLNANAMPLSQVRSTVENALADAGIQAPLEFQNEEALPMHFVAENGPFDIDWEEGAMVAALFLEASVFIDRWRAAHDGEPVLLWPSPFDVSSALLLDGEASITAGFSPGDVVNPEPYWFVAVEPRFDAAPADLPAGAVWHDGDWVGAMLPHGQGDPLGFFEACTQACRARLASHSD